MNSNIEQLYVKIQHNSQQKNESSANEEIDKNIIKQIDGDKCQLKISKINVDNKPITIKNSLVNDKTAAERVIGLRQTNSCKLKKFPNVFNDYTEKVSMCRFRLITAWDSLIGKVSYRPESFCYSIYSEQASKRSFQSIFVQNFQKFIRYRQDNFLQ